MDNRALAQPCGCLHDISREQCEKLWHLCNEWDSQHVAAYYLRLLVERRLAELYFEDDCETEKYLLGDD